MKLTTKQLTTCAVLTAMALALSYLEGFFPLSLAIPVPGIKLGLANIVTMFALYTLGPGQALMIRPSIYPLFLKVRFQSIFFFFCFCSFSFFMVFLLK